MPYINVVTKNVRNNKIFKAIPLLVLSKETTKKKLLPFFQIKFFSDIFFSSSNFLLRFFFLSLLTFTVFRCKKVIYIAYAPAAPHIYTLNFESNFALYHIDQSQFISVVVCLIYVLVLNKPQYAFV